MQRELHRAASLTTSDTVSRQAEGLRLYHMLGEQHGPLLEAQLNIATCYEHGLGTTENLREACTWFAHAAQLGDSRAQTKLAWYLFGAASASGSGQELSERHVPRAVELWEKAAAQGDLDAMHQLGHRYLEGEVGATFGARYAGDLHPSTNAGVHGVPKDLDRMKFWWTKAANGGHAEAQYVLGMSYHTGIHAPIVPLDKEISNFWLESAAAQGVERASWILGEEARQRALIRQTRKQESEAFERGDYPQAQAKCRALLRLPWVGADFEATFLAAQQLAISAVFAPRTAQGVARELRELANGEWSEDQKDRLRGLFSVMENVENERLRAHEARVAEEYARAAQARAAQEEQERVLAATMEAEAREAREADAREAAAREDLRRRQAAERRQREAAARAEREALQQQVESRRRETRALQDRLRAERAAEERAVEERAAEERAAEERAAGGRAATAVHGGEESVAVEEVAAAVRTAERVRSEEQKARKRAERRARHESRQQQAVESMAQAEQRDRETEDRELADWADRENERWRRMQQAEAQEAEELEAVLFESRREEQQRRRARARGVYSVTEPAAVAVRYSESPVVAFDEEISPEAREAADAESARIEAELARRNAHAPPDDQCVVCFDDIPESKQCRLPCQHWVCSECVRNEANHSRQKWQEWTDRGRPGGRAQEPTRDYLCPLCRRPVPPSKLRELTRV